MGFPKIKQFSLILFLTAASSTNVWAAPKLRLTGTTIGPVSIAQGQIGKTQTLGARNEGDGNLNLSFKSSAPWLNAQTGTNIPCSDNPGKSCIAINVGLATAGLSKGVLTGTLRVNDPNALDAPQDVVVTVQIGGGVPDKMSFYVAPNGSPVTQSIVTSNSFNPSTSGPGGGVTLEVKVPAVGSYATSYTYNVTVNAPQGTSEGPYNGSLNILGSAIPTDNNQVPVAIQVTSQPIATPYPASLYFKAAQGSAPQTIDVNFSNSGSNDLAVSGADPGSSKWLTAQVNGNTVTAAADPAGLANGAYNGTLTIAGNAANPLAVPVTLEVVDAGPPVSRFQTLVSVAGNAPATDPVAQGDVVTLQGELFTTQSIQGADPTVPLPTSLGGATVYVNDVAAPVFSISSNRIQFQIPYEVSAGDATVRVDRDGVMGNTLSAQLRPAAPRITSVQNQNGAQLIGSGTPVAVGDTLTIFGYGLGQTSPGVASGTPAPDGSALDPSLIVRFSTGGLFGLNLAVSPQSAMLVTGTIGLYQIVAQVPDGVPHGPSIAVSLELPDVAISKMVFLNIP